MDWIKVKTNHVLYEYTDLSPTEFQAWVKIMALTASLEREPTRDQMLKIVHYKTLDSLQRKLNTRSIDLQYVLNKVLIDVQDVLNKKLYWKTKKQELRAVKQNVQQDIQETSNNREDKIREDKIRIKKEKKEKIAFALPEWINQKTWDGFLEMRKAKRVATTDRAKALIVAELERLKKQGHSPEDVLNQSIMRSWTGVFPIKQETSNVRTTTNFSDKRPTLSDRQRAEDEHLAEVAARWEAAQKGSGGDSVGNAAADDVPDFQDPGRKS